MKTMMNEWITTGEAAEQLGLSESRVRGLLGNDAVRAQLHIKRLGPDTRGGQWLIAADSIAALATARLANPPRVGRPRKQA